MSNVLCNMYRHIYHVLCMIGGIHKCRPAMMHACGRYIHKTFWRFDRKYKSNKLYYDACQFCVGRKIWGPKSSKDFGCWNEERDHICQSRHEGTLTKADVSAAMEMPKLWQREDDASGGVNLNPLERLPFHVHRGPTSPPTPRPPTSFPTISPTAPPTDSPVPSPTPAPAPTPVMALESWLVNKAGLSPETAEKVRSCCELQKIYDVAQLHKACCFEDGEDADDDIGSEVFKGPVPAMREACELVEESFDTC